MRVVGDMPAAEVTIDAGLITRLLTAQHPDLADREPELVAAGWDCEMWRLGDELAARLPRRRVVADLIGLEQRWLPQLAPDLPLAVPAPIRVGAPDVELGYPFPWSVVPWFDGASALETPPNDAVRAAAELGAFLAALHRPAPGELAPSTVHRGAPLITRDAVLRSRVESLDDVDRRAVLRSWEMALEASEWAGPPVIVHGDLHPANLVVDPAGQLVAVIDFVDLAAGDPAVDLSVAWMLLPHGDRETLRRAAGPASRPVDDDTWTRARGNALAHAVAVLATSDDNARMSALARHTLAAVLIDG